MAASDASADSFAGGGDGTGVRFGGTQVQVVERSESAPKRFSKAAQRALERKQQFKTYISDHSVMEKLNEGVQVMFKTQPLPQDPLEFMVSHLKPDITKLIDQLKAENKMLREENETLKAGAFRIPHDPNSRRNSRADGTQPLAMTEASFTMPRKK